MFPPYVAVQRCMHDHMLRMFRFHMHCMQRPVLDQKPCGIRFDQWSTDCDTHAIGSLLAHTHTHACTDKYRNKRIASIQKCPERGLVPTRTDPWSNYIYILCYIKYLCVYVYMYIERYPAIFLYGHYIVLVLYYRVSYKDLRSCCFFPSTYHVAILAAWRSAGGETVMPYL